jgi:hypothetical protein
MKKHFCQLPFSGGCPILHYSIEYRRSNSTHFSLVTNSLPEEVTEYIIRQDNTPEVTRAIEIGE